MASEHNRTIPLERLFQVNQEIKAKTFQLYLALNPKQHKEGLSGLAEEELKEHEGMIFIYPISQKHTFWMKNTLIDLDLAYISASGEVIEIYTMPKMSTKLFTSTQKVPYVLELKAGTFNRIGLEVGDTIHFSKKFLAYTQP